MIATHAVWGDEIVEIAKWSKAPAVIVSCCVAEAIVEGDVLAAVIVGVPTFVSV